MPEPERHRPALLERVAKFFTTLAGVIAAAVVLGGAITGAVAFIRGGDNGEPTANENAQADIAVTSFDKNVDYRDYRGRPGRTLALTARDEDPGNVFYLQLRIAGFKRETVHLRWFTYDVSGERQPYSPGEARAEELFEPEAPVTTQVAQVWVKEPGAMVEGVWEPEPGEYFVRFELYSGDVLLVSKDSPRFSVVG